MNVLLQRKPRRFGRLAIGTFGLALLGATLWGVANAQTPAPPTAQTPPPAAEPPPSPGFFGAVGQWVQQGAASVGAGFGTVVDAIGGRAGDTARGMTDGASTVAKGAADVARDTAVTVTRLPATGFISGREQCPLAPNGAPDCRAAAETMCRASGYRGGSSVDFDNAEKCPPASRQSSRSAPQGACIVEHFVTRALCQ
jgi:hypothetical protein